jgi:DNA-binding NarL/FixJ family response regulator
MRLTEKCKGCPNAIDEVQKKILLLLAEGKTNKDVAETMSFSEASVKRRVTILMNWFGATNRTNLISLAIKKGAIDF